MTFEQFKTPVDSQLKDGEEVELHLVGERQFEASKKPSPPELVARLRQLRGHLPADFHFNRLEANEDAPATDRPIQWAEPKGAKRRYRSNKTHLVGF
jgi:antitoxin MazE